MYETFTYSIPDGMDVRLGTRVEVPLATKRVTGFVIGVDGHPPDGVKLKPIRAVLDSGESALIPEIVELCRWAAEYYIAPAGMMLRVALPANMSARARPGDELRDAVGVRYDRWASVIPCRADGE